MRRFVTISTCVLVLVVFGAVATQARADLVPAAATCMFQAGNDPNSGGNIADNVGIWAYPNEPNGTAYRFDMSAYSGQVAQGDGTFTIYLRTDNPWVSGGNDPTGVKIQLYTMDPADSDWEEMQATYNDKKTGVAWSYGSGKAFDYILQPSTLVGELTYDSATHGLGPLNITVSKAAIDQGIAAGAINWMAKTDNWDTGPSYYGFRVCSNQWDTESMRPVLSFMPESSPVDLDGDGYIDEADLALLQANWGSAIYTAGDLDGNGLIGLGDAEIIRRNWYPNFGAGAGAVPEPGSLALLAIGSLALLVLRRRCCI